MQKPLNLKIKIDERYVFIVIAIAVAITFVIASYIFFVPVKANDHGDIKVIIEEGESSRSVARVLKENGLIRSETAFLLYASVRGESQKIKAGRYQLSKALNIPKIAAILVSGKSSDTDRVVFIPEGFNVWEVDERLTQDGLIKEGGFSSQYYGDEGYLFPDTYRIRNFEFRISNLGLGPDESTSSNSASSVGRVVEELKQKMEDNFSTQTTELLEGLSLEEIKKIIIIASILEKEVRTEKDMGLVAGIIYKRLELEMLLQVDATVTYGACLRSFEFQISNFEFENCDVTLQGPAKEILIDGPYNTYKNQGLPPGPISNPGLQSIKAALNPIESDYLYYLTPRGTSQIIYSKTGAEHEANRRKYLGI